MTDPETPELQPLPYATRVEIVKTPSVFTASVSGVLTKHALWRANGGMQQGDQEPEDIALGLAIVRNPDAYLPAALRLILFSSKRADLEDVTALAEDDIEVDVQESWGTLKAMFADAA